MPRINQEQIDECWEAMYQHAPKSIAWNHYDFNAKVPEITIPVWKEFLALEEVAEWLEVERGLLQSSEFAKLTTNLQHNSVGQAQLISALNRVQNDNKVETATGPAFIYTYIPLSQEQKHAPNTKELEEDIFFVPPTKFEFKDT